MRTDRQAIVRAVAYVAAAFSKQLSPETVDVFVRELDGIRPEVLQRCAHRLVREREFWPPVAAWLEAAQIEREIARDATPALTEGDLSEEDRRRNLEELGRLMASVGIGVPA